MLTKKKLKLKLHFLDAETIAGVNNFVKSSCNNNSGNLVFLNCTPILEGEGGGSILNWIVCLMSTLHMYIYGWDGIKST